MASTPPQRAPKSAPKSAPQRDPRLASASLWTLIYACVLFMLAVVLIRVPELALLCGLLATLFLIIGIGVRRPLRWAAILGAATFTALALGLASAILDRFTIGRLGLLGGSAWLAAVYWQYVLAPRQKTPEPPGGRFEEAGGSGDAETEDADAEDEEEAPMISLVLLLSKPRYLEETVLAEIVQDAWGGRYIGDDEDELDGFVVGDDGAPVFVVKAPFGMFLVHNRRESYWAEQTEEVADEIGELRLRKAVMDHRAWLSVDAMGLAEDDDQDAAYARIIRLITALADPEDTLAVLRPETRQINIWSDDVFDALIRPGGAEKFTEAGNVPVIPVEADDPLMVAAVETARSRWPEFATAFSTRAPDDSFSIKAAVTVDEVTEYIWLTVDGIGGDVVFGKLANDPVDLGDLRLGSEVEVELEDLNDWAYRLGDSEPVGLFTVEAIDQAQRRHREA